MLPVFSCFHCTLFRENFFDSPIPICVHIGAHTHTEKSKLKHIAHGKLNKYSTLHSQRTSPPHQCTNPRPVRTLQSLHFNTHDPISQTNKHTYVHIESDHILEITKQQGWELFENVHKPLLSDALHTQLNPMQMNAI